MQCNAMQPQNSENPVVSSEVRFSLIVYFFGVGTAQPVYYLVY